jgi:hypothetical protein
MHISFRHKGSFRKTESFMSKASKKDFRYIFDRYGMIGVRELEVATPRDSGLTANSWSYKVNRTSKGYSLGWYNSNMAGNTPLVILIQYGHGTRGGAFVQGTDFINPAIRSVLDKIAEDIWKEVIIL